ncbi:Potassium/proton antiporter [Rhodovastum atsumiense]|nr:potassium/proton antiporter [Rhodovastum atsumiense]CAH2601310.1 Potassium/proton antiporter [Rhodovastum atsumiense]
MMATAHLLILAIGATGLLSILAGLLSRRIGAPLLLVFLGIGMIVGEAAPGLVYADFRSAYVIGSVALAVILFDGGLSISPRLLRLAWGPALLLATVGVALTAGVVGVAVKLLMGAPSWPVALLVGATMAPTDAAAVGALLRRAGAVLPERVHATLELESGLNDPASVFLTLLLMMLIHRPESVGAADGMLMFLQQMGGGAALGAGGGLLLVALLRHVPAEASLVMVLALAGVLTLFGLAQVLDTSGFLAVTVAALIVGPAHFPARPAFAAFFGGLAWLAQVVLFVMLGLLVTPAQLLPLIGPMAMMTAVLILLARPVAVLACLAPFGFAAREVAFISWVGLRGAAPIYLSIVPAIADPRGLRLFDSVFVVVVASLLVQGWTIGPVARLLGFGQRGGRGACD